MLAFLWFLFAVAPTPLPWAMEGDFVPEDAVFELNCVQTAKQLYSVACATGILRISKGELSYLVDSECGDLRFVADFVSESAAEGSFALKDSSGEGKLLFDRFKYAQVWREGSNILLRGAIGSFGACELTEGSTSQVRIRRYVPRSVLNQAAVDRAAALGLPVPRCAAKPAPYSPRIGSCGLSTGKPAKPAK